ncbi:YkvI family membrane protein [Bacillus solimangrovi]|uniref:Membrane protein YkvI n=1 Tax=Bacillus solimangrovi TaxID=1305675 RepID=A0A1E5LCD1_9BACI|nr:hypothetical protein [Bacillus solimangrovi]OEH91744.1 hypothetical protein BFG57_17850 [Bacillus solimangrovi]
MWRAGLKWNFLIMGTMIGAGYASGREIWQFFGEESGLAIVIFSVLFSLSCYVIMSMSFEQQTSHYIPILEKLVGKKLTYVYDWMIIFYLFTTTVVMIAGGGVALEMFYIPYWLGIAFISILLILLFCWDTEGMLSINSLLLPLLITGLAFVLIVFAKSSENPFVFHWDEQSNWPSAFTFTALNILPLVAVLAAVGKEIKHRGEILIASIGSGLALGMISFLYNESLLHIASEIVLYEIPLFAILKQFPYSMLIFMSILLWAAIYTTAASGIFGLISRFRKLLKAPAWIIAGLFVLFMLPLTKFGFSTLISFLYPLYGLVNLYMLASILLYPFSKRYSS